MTDGAPMFEPGDIFASLMGSPSPPRSPPPKQQEDGPDEDELAAMMAADEERSLAADIASLSPRAEAAAAETVAREADRSAAQDEEKRQRAAAAARRRAAILAAMDDEDEPIFGTLQEQTPTPALSATQTRGVGQRSQPEASGSVSESRQFEPEFVFDMDEASTSRTRSPTPASRVIFDAAGRPLRAVRAETANGSTVMFKRRAKPRAPVDLAHAGQKDALDLLSTPLHILKQQADEIRSMEKARDIDRSYAPGGEKKLKIGLWVDKYRPTKFADLLGEDRVHRDVMTWLKEWDRCVFKRQTAKKRKMEDENTDTYYHDALGRPRERILLLSGPPGYGKTTLAHVVAKQAGYRTLEINASDDRNAATVTTRIQNAIDAGTGLGAEGRPTCVVIDEIDGASGGGDASFVKSLIKLIQDVPAKKKSNTPAKPLRRPIICICNDLYATSLRPLRPFARIVRFRKPPNLSLVDRLRDICGRERLKADQSVLTLLVDLAGADIRSCMNTLQASRLMGNAPLLSADSLGLVDKWAKVSGESREIISSFQFIKSRSSVVTADAVKSSAVGVKDSGTSLQAVWNALFIPMGAKQRRKEIGLEDGRYVDRLAFMVQACGEYDRVVQGCFEHYPNLKPLDTSFSNICRLHDWLGYCDHLSNHIGENLEFELMAYQPYAIVPWHSHFAAPSNATRQAEWPKADYEAYLTRVGNEEISRSFKSAIPPTLRSLFSSTTTLTELIPLVMRVISPPLKPVNANIVKASERAVLARLVELLIPLGFRFWQEKTEDGQPQMRLEPAIDVFVHYDEKRAGDIVASRFAVRQLVAQAMDAEVARRRGQAEGGTATSTAQLLAEQYGAAKTGLAKKPDEPAAVPTDFFGRVRVRVPAAAAVEKSGNDADESACDDAVLPEADRVKFRAVYRFNEGSSSAVRTNVKMSALM